MAEQSRSFPEMLREALREIAVLIIVFAPLDRRVDHRSYTWIDLWETFAISALLFLMGVILEKLRAL
jgi:hypothetical protein